MNLFEAGPKILDGMASLCFPLSLFWGEKGLKLARGAVVSAIREAVCSSFDCGLGADNVCRWGVEGWSLGREVEVEGTFAAFESFL